MPLMADNAKKLPGNGLLGWLGRQFGHVKKAVETDVTDGLPDKEAADSKTVYRDCRIEEKDLPEDSNVKLRRTVIDEVIVKGVQSAERRAQSEEGK